MSITNSSEPLLTPAVDAPHTPPMPPQTPSAPSLPSRKHPIWPLLSLLILVHFATALYTLPLNRVIERRLCYEHYARLDPHSFPPNDIIPEKVCKVDAVQRQLAWLQGIMETTLVVCDFLVTIPFSFVAEKWGIRVVLWCNLVPRVFVSIWAMVVGRYAHFLPTSAIIVGPLLNVLGGECVLQSTIFTLTSALTDEYVQRASFFSYISSTAYVVSFLGPTVAAFIMSRSLWLPFWINIVLLLSAIPIIRLLPDTRRASMITTSSVDINSGAGDEVGALLEERASSPERYPDAFKTLPGLYENTKVAARKLIDLVSGRRNFQVLLCSFFLTALASSDTKLLVQYISKRYEWTFAEAGYMLSMKALVNFILLVYIVPRAIYASMSSKPVKGSEVRLNYLGAESSILVSVFGVFCIALAFKFWMLLIALIIYALGSALPVFTMSLVKSPLVALANSDIQDFSIVMLIKTLGSLVGAPLMTILWVLAIKIGNIGLGLPYFASACIYLAAAFVVSRLQI